MTLKQWADNGWLKTHRTSREEMGNLLSIVERDLKDADELIAFSKEFKDDVEKWLEQKHQNLA